MLATLIAALLVATLTPLQSVRAGPCDQVGGVISGDWTVTTAQVCTGILFTVDGSVTIEAGGSLTLIDGGLKFAKDTAHTDYALTVNDGGDLILDNSIVTTETNAVSPYLKLAFTLSGSNSQLTMLNGAVLRFPGWFNATGASIDLTDSTITGFTSEDLLGLGVYMDDNDDSPVLSWNSVTASLYRSSIERIYENATAANDPNATGVISGNIALSNGSALYAYDSYLGVDFSNVVGLHNELRVDATSNAYLYGVTIDRTEDPVLQSDWEPAFVPEAAGGSIFLLRWLHLLVVDSTAFPVSGSQITATLSPSATLASYPDNGGSATPSARTLAYLGRDATGPNAWDRTNESGAALLPLYTDLITTASLPNADSFGSYTVDVTFDTALTSGGVGFDPYPATAWETNNEMLTLTFSDLTVRTGPDLALRSSDYSPIEVIQGQSFTVDALIYNQGQTTATGVSVAAYLDGDRGSELARADGLTVETFVNRTLTVAGVSTTGSHTLMLVVDPDNAINEGGAAQETNNFANVTLNVLPPPDGFVAILSPSSDATIEAGSSVSVTGYVRDENGTGLVGIPLTIELRSGTSVLATNVTRTEAFGFFMGVLVVPADAPDGVYQVVVSPSSGPISADTRTVTILQDTSFLNVPILGISIWLWLLVIIGIAAAVGGGTAYVKYVGIGKLVECGECGAFIPRDSSKCPKCGVEFERDMAKCSNCATWIPINVKVCPECGVEFATGEVELADYEAQMRQQYEEVKRRFREEARRELGRSLDEREFEEWWRTQPTFVTFENWLKEEEEMRRLGSKPCPVCATLNSVTATVCHKCGTLLNEELRRGQTRSVPSTREAAGKADPPSQPVAPKVWKKVIRKTSPEEPPGGAEGEKAAGDQGKADGDADSDDIV